MSDLVRLDRLLANRGYCARSEVEDFVIEADVRVNGEVPPRVAARVRSESVTVGSNPIDPSRLVLLLHKPLGYVCSHKEDGKRVYDLLPARWRNRSPAISTVGRLDKDTSGVILLTDDGSLNHRLTSPRTSPPKIYRATLDRPCDPDTVGLFAAGTLMLEGEKKPLLPAKLTLESATVVSLVLHEGRYHQVRRMFAATGNHVLALERLAVGPFTTEGLIPGEFREIADHELGKV